MMIASHLTDAIQECEQALKTNTNFAEACQRLGNLLQGSGRFQEAILWHTRALQPQLDRVEVLVGLATLYAKQEQWEQARATFESALALEPNSAEAHRGLANLYQKLGQSEAESRHRYQAVLHKPDWATHANQLVLGNTLLQQGRVNEAIDCYRRAIQLQPQSYEAHYDLAVALTQHRDWVAAEQSFRTALELNPTHASSALGLGKMAEQRGDYATAIDCYWRAIEQAPTLLTTYTTLGDLLLRHNRVDETVRLYQKLVDVNPDMAWSHHNLGYALLKQQQFQAAVPPLRRAIELEPNSSAYYHNLGDALMALGELDEAAAAYRRAIELNPSFAWSHHNLGEVLTRQAKWEDLIETARSAINSGHDHPWAYVHLGRGFTAKNEPLPAIACYQKGAALRGWERCLTKAYRFTQDWFTHNTPVLLEFLSSYAHQPGLQFLEIGSFQGMSTCWLFDHILTHPSVRLTCIDPTFQPEFATNIAKCGAIDRLVQITGNSHEVLQTLPTDHYDVIYVDGCHWAFHVEKDGIYSWPLLKRGGLMIFDDYHWSDPDYPGEDTKLGIDAFLQTIEGHYQVMHWGYQLIIQKR